jgi:hypothetical protein
MRVENGAGLVPGDQLQLALHSYAGEVPLVLRARVLRTEPSGEAALAFVDLSLAQRVVLDKILFEVAGGDGPALVSELLEPSPRLDE